MPSYYHQENVTHAGRGISGHKPIPRRPVREPTCPVCHGPVDRIHRRFIDRLMSWFRPARRYRCRKAGWGCDWEGNFYD